MKQFIACTALIVIAGSGCGDKDAPFAAARDRDPEAPVHEEITPAPDSPEPEPEPHEPVIAHGAARVERAFIRPNPDAGAPSIGTLRWGAAFEIVETRDVGEETWYRMTSGGWVRDDDVRTRTAGPVELGWTPVAPRLDEALPYRYTRVTAPDGVPVYRRPPRRGEDPQRVHMRDLQEGYFFTVDKWVNIYDRQLYRTTRYWFIPREGTTPLVAPTFEGIEIDGGVEVPFLWVTDPTARLCPEPETTETCTGIERHRRIPFHERREGSATWYRTDGGWIPALQVAYVDRIAPPSAARPGERWIHVDLRNQTAALYQGERMVYATLISSGEVGHETPTGTFRVESKHVTATMDDEDNLNGPYYIQDVPWVLYFRGSYALHGAFWHDRFGLKSSHGCVNLSPADARRFFNFATSPELPEGWHGVYHRGDEEPGTLVHISG